jgi:hypothetical protein
VLRTINAVRGRRVETDYQEDVHDFLMHPRKGTKKLSVNSKIPFQTVLHAVLERTHGDTQAS